jgi:hypothetical protein
VTARIRALLAGLEDPYALRRRRRDLLDEAAADLRVARFSEAARSLRRSPDGDVPPPRRSVADHSEALRAAEREVAASEERWAALAGAVEEEEAALGAAPPPPEPAVLAELSLLTSAGSALKEGFAPRGSSFRTDSGDTGMDRVAAVGVGLVAAALGAPHVAVHLAMSAGEEVRKAKRARPKAARHGGTRAMQALRAGLPRGEPSADGVHLALDDLAHAPRDRGAWERFLDAAQERVAALGRAHLRARAAAVLAAGERP